VDVRVAENPNAEDDPVLLLNLKAVSEAMDESSLIRQAKEGDLRAFEDLYRSYAGRIHGLCLRMTRNADRAEELTQESFVRAWEKLASFRGDSTFLTWLHRLAVNVVLGDLRARGRWAARFEEVAEPGDLPDHGGGPRPSGTTVDLERAIGTLPPQARTVFLLFDVEGYGHREIADMTGLAEGTSKAHLHRARQLLRKALNR
jgi:RNA polymerase sigma factor (sigma-70 family)